MFEVVGVDGNGAFPSRGHSAKRAMAGRSAGQGSMERGGARNKAILYKKVEWISEKATISKARFLFFIPLPVLVKSW